MCAGGRRQVGRQVGSGREWAAYGSLSMSCSVLAIGVHCAAGVGAMAYWVLSSGDLVRHDGLVPDSGVLRRHGGLLVLAGGDLHSNLGEGVLK